MEESKGLDIYNRINANVELETLEMKGFIEGEKKGKTMDVTLAELVDSLVKQKEDFQEAYENKQISAMKKALADLRNVAGCVFLKLLEGGDKKE